MKLYFKKFKITVDIRREKAWTGRHPDSVQIDFLVGDPRTKVSYPEERVVCGDALRLYHISAIDMLPISNALFSVGKLNQIDKLFYGNSADFLNSICHAACNLNVPGEQAYYKAKAHSTAPERWNAINAKLRSHMKRKLTNANKS